MKLNYIKSIAIAALLTVSLTGCINSDDYNNPQSTVPENCVEPDVKVTKTVADIFAAAGGGATLYKGKDVIEAYVNSSDERGNFFKIVYLQTLGDNPIGLSIAIDKTTLFGANFYPGRKVYIKLENLYTANVEGVLAIGALYEGAIGRIAEYQYANFIFPSCSQVSEDLLVKRRSITQALQPANLNTLIELQDVQFAGSFLGGTYYDEKDTDNTAGGATNRTLVDATGNSVVLRTSSFANFSGNKIPEGNGTVRGILTIYRGVYQFVVRNEQDIQLTKPRYVPTVNFRSAFTETFESYNVTTNTFPDYTNTNTVGSRFWSVKTFSGNKYIEMTSFTSGGSNVAYFIAPVNFTAASTFSFDKEIRNMAGEALKVYYVTEANYNPSAKVDTTKFVDITSSFANLIYPAPSGSQNNFTPAGTYNIPEGLAGNGYFVFEYSGTTTVTTTIQIDNIKVQ